MGDRIECSGCKKWRGQDGYSKRQLAGSKNKIKCRDCTGEQVKELTCIVCTDVKDLGEFSRAQRRVPDHAVRMSQRTTPICSHARWPLTADR